MPNYISICRIYMPMDECGPFEEYQSAPFDNPELAMNDICRLYGDAHGITHALAGDWLAGLEMEFRLYERILCNGRELSADELEVLM